MKTDSSTQVTTKTQALSFLTEKKIPVENWAVVFSYIERLCSRYDEGSTLTQAHLLSELSNRSLKIERKKFNQWVTAGILKSVSRPDLSGHPLYNLFEIKKAFLCAYLLHHHNLSPSELAIVVQIYATGPWNDTPALHVRDLNEVERARLILTGRLLAVCGALATGGRIPPENTVIIGHQIPSIHPVKPHKIWYQKPSEIMSLLKPTENIIGWTAEGTFGEVFSVMKDSSVIAQRMGERNFFSIPVTLPNEVRSYAITLGVEKETKISNVLTSFNHQSPLSLFGETVIKQLWHLLNYSLKNVTRLQDALTSFRISDDASLLSVLVTSIRLEKPHRWLSAAFYGHNGSVSLSRRVHSADYPQEKYPSLYHLPRKLSPLNWVYKHKTHLVINWPQMNDFRLTSEFSDIDQAHAFIPALQQDQCTGVLHIIGNVGDFSKEPCFAHDDIGLLYVLARTLGEAYQRNMIASIDDVCRTITIPHLDYFNKDDLSSTLAQLIRIKIMPIPNQNPNFSPNGRYLALFAIKAYQRQNKERLEAFLDLVRQRTVTYFRQYFIDRPQFEDYERSFRLDEESLIFVANDLSENEIRRMRQELQTELDEISLVNPTARTQCYVWTVHIPYEYIQNNFQQSNDHHTGFTYDESAVTRATADILMRTISALKIIGQVKRADASLTQRDYREAESYLTDACTVDPENSYVWRHLSEAQFGLGRYDKAIDSAKKAIEIDTKAGIRLASNHQRLAEACFGQGNVEDAFEEMKIACAISQDLRYRRAFIQILILLNEEASLHRALHMIINTEEQVEPEDYRTLAWLEHLRGEARLLLNDRDQALEAFEKAASMSPMYHDPAWDILRIKLSRKH